MIKQMIFSVLLAFCAVFFARQTFSAEKHYGDVQAKMESNYDGDTITVSLPDYPPIIGDHIAVRINGIDTAELHGTVGDIHDKAVQAKEFVAQWCPVGAVISLKNIGRDKYFRIDATVICGEVNIAKALIDKGPAKPYDGGTKQKWN
jgi:micrococcal nuclease